jgi:hypothetical protein
VAAKITKVACQGCGAVLEVDESVRFVTCRYCASRLEICHEPSTIYSKLLEDVARTQKSAERELRLIRLERQLDRLDKTWKSFADSVSTKSRDGSLHQPGGSDSILVMVVTVLIGLLLLLASFQSRDHWPLAVLAVGVFFTGLMISRHAKRRAREFGRARRRYLERRAALKLEITKAETGKGFPRMRRSGRPARRE